jgi:hypothetical protein
MTEVQGVRIAVKLLHVGTKKHAPIGKGNNTIGNVELENK